MRSLIDSSDSSADILANSTGSFSYLSLFGLLFIPLVLLTLTIFIRYLIPFLRKKPLPDSKTWLLGLGIYLILAFFFATDFGYHSSGQSEDYHRLYYGIPFLWLFGFFAVQFWRHKRKKLFIITLALTGLPSFFLIYILLKPAVELSFIENRQIPFPFWEGDCINLVSVQNKVHEETVCFRSSNRYLSLF
jgi:hypothetical protein